MTSPTFCVRDTHFAVTFARGGARTRMLFVRLFAGVLLMQTINGGVSIAEHSPLHSRARTAQAGLKNFDPVISHEGKVARTGSAEPFTACGLT